MLIREVQSNRESLAGMASLLKTFPRVSILVSISLDYAENGIASWEASNGQEGILLTALLLFRLLPRAATLDDHDF